jgi:hypothetical protein
VETLPTASVATVKDGFWFVFNSGAHLIRAWGSVITGMERVYLDDKLVSERRSVGKDSKHSFVIENENYAVAFKTTSVMKGELQCSLLKNEAAIQVLALKYVKSNLISGSNLSASLGRLLLLFLAGAGIVFVGRYFDFPSWVQLVALALLFLLLRRGHEEGKYSKGGFVIEEIDLATGTVKGNSIEG